MMLGFEVVGLTVGTAFSVGKAVGDTEVGDAQGAMVGRSVGTAVGVGVVSERRSCRNAQGTIALVFSAGPAK